MNILISLIFFFSFQTLNAAEIRFCYEDVSVFPWITGDDQGVALKEIHQVEKIINQKFILVRVPWKRCQIEAEEGHFEGLLAASVLESRKSWGVYPEDNEGQIDRDLRMHTDSFYLYVKKGSPIKYKNGNFININNNPIGVQLGYSVGADLVKMGFTIHSAFTAAYDVAKELDMGAVKVAALQDHEAVKILNSHPQMKKKFKRIEPPIKVADQYLLLTKKFVASNPPLAKEIWKAIKVARNSPEYRKSLEETLKEK